MPLIERIEAYLRQVAPHQRERLTVQLLTEALAELVKYRMQDRARVR